MPPRSKSDCPTCAPRSATNRSCNRVDPAAVKREETCDEYPKTHEHHCACADPPEVVETQRAPEPKAEEDDQDPGEVRPNLVEDPRLVRGQRPEIRRSVVRRAVSVRLRERAPDVADTDRDKYEKPTNPGRTEGFNASGWELLSFHRSGAQLVGGAPVSSFLRLLLTGRRPKRSRLPAGLGHSYWSASSTFSFEARRAGRIAASMPATIATTTKIASDRYGSANTTP